MSVWYWAAFILLLCMVPAFLLCIKGDAVNRLVGLEAGSTIASTILLLLAIGDNRVPFVDIALTLALLSFGAGLVFTRFLERWL